MRLTAESTYLTYLTDLTNSTPPKLLQIPDALLRFLRRQFGAELEHFDVLLLHERLQRGEVDGAGAGRAVIVAGEGDVMEMEPREVFRHGREVFGVLDESEVFLDLGMAGVVPVEQVAAGDLLEQFRVIAFERQFFEGLAVFDAEDDAAFDGFGHDLLERIQGAVPEQLLLRLAPDGEFGAELPVIGLPAVAVA